MTKAGFEYIAVNEILGKCYFSSLRREQNRIIFKG
jgi:hypothetical protein